MKEKNEYCACDYWIEVELNEKSKQIENIKDIDDLIFADEITKLHSER